MNKQTIGRCSNCGGAVTLPVYFHSVVTPQPECEDCGAVAKARGPVIDMGPPRNSKIQSVQVASLLTTGEKVRWSLHREIAPLYQIDEADWWLRFGATNNTCE